MTKGCPCESWVGVKVSDLNEQRFLHAMTAAVVAFCRDLHPNEKGGFGAATQMEMVRLAEYILRMVTISHSDGIKGDKRIPP